MIIYHLIAQAYKKGRLKSAFNVKSTVNELDSYPPSSSSPSSPFPPMPPGPL